MVSAERFPIGLSLVILVCLAYVCGICYIAIYPPRQATRGFSKPDIETCEFQSVSGNVNSPSSYVTVYAQSTGGGPVVLDCAVIKDSLGDSLEVIQEQNIEDNNANTAVDAPRVDADWTKLDIAVTPGTLIAGEYYTLTLVSKIGNSFVSPSFKPTV